MQLVKAVKTCNLCCAFRTVEENKIFPVAEIIYIKNRGKLIYPNLEMYSIFKNIENFFVEKLQGMNVYDEVIQEIMEQKIKLSFPCREHKKIHCQLQFIIIYF